MGYVHGLRGMYYRLIQYMYSVLLPFSHRLVFNSNRILMRQFLSFNDMHLVKDGFFHYVMSFEHVDGYRIVARCYFLFWWFKFSGEIEYVDGEKSFFDDVFGFCLTDSQYRFNLGMFRRVIDCKWF